MSLAKDERRGQVKKTLENVADQSEAQPLLIILAGGLYIAREELRNGKAEATECQRWRELLLGDRCRIKGVCLTRLRGKYKKGRE